MSEDLMDLSPEEGIERFLRHREPSVRESTMRNAKTRLRFFNEWCEERDIENLNNLTGRDLADFVAWRRGDIAALTLQKQLSTIREALRYWADIEGVDDGLAEKVHAPELPDGAESREVHLSADRAHRILDYLHEYRYASRDHVVFLILWKTAMRRSALRSLDVDDLRPDDYALVLEHRIDEGTKLKNGEDGERWVYLGPSDYQVVDDYLDNPDRYERTDDYGRKPLITSQHGRPAGDTIYKWVNKLTQPCVLGGCPHDADPSDPSTCEALGSRAAHSKCPSSRSPHGLRRGSITYHLNSDVSPEIVSERCDVSLEVLYEHYDVRTNQEKMAVRKKQLERI
ncbi:integrase [Haloarcula taiwanensis]|uniref:Integrase n=1 Tax=Haloarcula taiwanensis TaxID=1932004 RepID=A0A2H5A1A5_9EURY|nr:MULTISPECIES: site-specific integrase [Haloarcula]AUG48526.1 integrase [Haloarcula taiwanensis]KZX47090.1 integrase [Haloarcula sp. K1]